MTETKLFARPDDGEWTVTPEGNRRRVVLLTDELMMVEFAFAEGGIGWLHSHPHVQASYVAEGSFEVTIGDRTETLSAGAGFIVPSNIVHGVKALAAGRLIDSFTPARTDFLG
jgi:quercetin dioxygenase-like cupin family protein